jgi:arylsulfatase A-like enzyme
MVGKRVMAPFASASGSHRSSSPSTTRHLCPEAEMNLASTRRNWPSGRGLERWYGFLGAGTNNWYPELVYDNHPVEPPRSPEEGY